MLPWSTPQTLQRKVTMLLRHFSANIRFRCSFVMAFFAVSSSFSKMSHPEFDIRKCTVTLTVVSTSLPLVTTWRLVDAVIGRIFVLFSATAGAWTLVSVWGWNTGNFIWYELVRCKFRTMFRFKLPSRNEIMRVSVKMNLVTSAITQQHATWHRVAKIPSDYCQKRIPSWHSIAETRQ